MTSRLYDEMEVRKALRRSVNAAGIFDFAKVHKLSPVYLKGVCTGDLVPSERLLTALGFNRVTRYVRKVPSKGGLP